MNSIKIYGKQFPVTENKIFVDSATFQKITLRDVPESMVVLSSEYPEKIPEIMGLGNLGAGFAEVWVCIVLYIEESIVSEEAYEQAMARLFTKREQKFHDVRDVEGNGELEGQYSWFAVKVNADTTDLMFQHATQVADEFNRRLENLARDIQRLVNSIEKD